MAGWILELLENISQFWSSNQKIKLHEFLYHTTIDSTHQEHLDAAAEISDVPPSWRRFRNHSESPEGLVPVLQVGGFARNIPMT